jgi:hypothetical protein
MNEEQFQRTADFILAQQAKFSTDIAELKEQNKTNTANIAKLAELILSLANYNQQQDEQIAALIESGKETDRRFRETDERMRETDERIGILIKVVERFYNRNGE